MFFFRLHGEFCPLRLQGSDSGAEEKLVGSTICRLRTGAGAARCCAAAQALPSQGKRGTKGTWKKCEPRNSWSSASGWLLRGFGGDFPIPHQCCAQVGGKAVELVALPRATGRHTVIRCCARMLLPGKWGSGECLGSDLNPQTCPSCLSKHPLRLSQLPN